MPAARGSRAGRSIPLLSNPVYIGEIAHKGARYKGQHAAILDQESWEGVQQLRAGAPARHGRAQASPSPLKAKLFDEAGHRLTPSHATKAGRRYRYYVSRPLVTGTAAEAPGAWRIPAAEIEQLVAGEAMAMLAEPGPIAAALEGAGLPAERLPDALAKAELLRQDLGREATQAEALAGIVHRIELSPIRLRLMLSLAALLPSPAAAPVWAEAVLTGEVPLRIQRRGVEMRLVIAGPSAGPAKPDPVLLKEVRRAHRCFAALLSGDAGSLAELARREGVSDRYLSRVLPLAFLAPDIVEAIACGHQPAELTAHRLIRTLNLPIAWAAQKQLLGLA